MFVNRNSQLPNFDELNLPSTIKSHYWLPPPGKAPVNLPSLHKKRRLRRPRSASGFYVPISRRTNFVLQLLHRPKAFGSQLPVNGKAGMTLRRTDFFKTRYGRDILDGNCPIVATTNSLRGVGKRGVSDFLRDSEGRRELEKFMSSKKEKTFLTKKDGKCPIGRHFQMKRYKKGRRKVATMSSKSRRNFSQPKRKKRTMMGTLKDGNGSHVGLGLYFGKYSRGRKGKNQNKNSGRSTSKTKTKTKNERNERKMRKRIRKVRRQNRIKLEEIKSVERLIHDIDEKTKIF